MRLQRTAIPLIESAYQQLDAPVNEWLRTLRQDAERTFAGVIDSAQAWEFEVDRTGSYRTTAMEADEPFRTTFELLHRMLPRRVIRKGYFEGSGVPTLSATLDRAGTGRRTRAAILHATGLTGVGEIVGAIGLDPGGRGVGLSWLLPARAPLARPVSATLMRVAAHVASAARLRHRSDAAPEEAWLAPDGRVLDAEGDAKDANVRASLRDAAIRIDRARMRVGGDLDAPAEFWTALVDGTWSLVERFDSDGRRLLVARRNDPTTSASNALSQTERKVVALTAIGHGLKMIAYELGVSEAQVSRLARSAMNKMGVRTRHELIELHGAVVQTPAPRSDS